MKYLRNFLLGLGLLLLVAATLVWFLPASWAMWWIEPQLHGLRLQRVHGTLWDGAADAVLSRDGEDLGQLHWRLSRRALLGQAHLQLDLDGPRLALNGTLQSLPHRQIDVRALQAHADLALFSRYFAASDNRPEGELWLTLDHALLQSGWPMELQARGIWRHAAMHTRSGTIPLGELRWQAQSHGGVLQLRLRDHGDGPLQARGELLLSPLGWRLDATLRNRHTDPALSRWLAQWGPPAADGSVHIQRKGGLADTLSTAQPTPEHDQHEP